MHERKRGNLRHLPPHRSFSLFLFSLLLPSAPFIDMLKENARPEEILRFEHTPWYFKTMVMITVLLLSVGSHFSASAISALKSTVKSVGRLLTDHSSYTLLTIYTLIGTRD